MSNPKAILFTTKVLMADSDGHDDMLKATLLVENGLSSWPRFYLDCANYVWLSRINFSQAYAVSAEFESRVEWLTRQFLRENVALTPDPEAARVITQELASDLAKQIVSVFHQPPLYAESGDMNYRIAMRRCQPAGSLQRLTNVYHYVLTCEEQLTEWLAGRPMHNYLRNECCPDFSCCSSDQLAPLEIRQQFVDANDSDRLAILSTFLSGTASNFYIPFPPQEGE